MNQILTGQNLENKWNNSNIKNVVLTKVETDHLS